MATAKITVEGNAQICLYKHFDGDPESTLPWLEWFNKDFTSERGDDPEYKLAQLIRSSVRDCQKFNLDPSIYTGWGVGLSKNFDCNFAYILHKDGTVTGKRG